MIAPGVRQVLLRGGKSIHPSARAYASLVGLTSDQTSALSQHLKEIETAGATVVELLLGQSAWMARSGSTWRAVIGNPASITGSVTNASDGQQLSGTSGTKITFNNPLRSASLANFGMMVVGRALTGSTGQAMFGGYNGTANRGPLLALNSAPLVGTNNNNLFWNYGDGATSSQAGSQSFKDVNSGGIQVFAAGFGGGANRACYAGAWQAVGGATAPSTVWNDNPNWSIGSRLDTTECITGAIQYALVTSNYLTADQYAAIYNSGMLRGIFAPETTAVMVGTGDSLMAGTTSPNNADSSLTHQITYTSAGVAWRHVCTAANEGVPGSSITSVEGIQRTNALRWVRANGFANRWIVHFGMHNDAEYQSSNEATRNGLIERYISVWKEMQGYGAKIAVVSPLVGSGGTEAQYTASAAYRTRLETRCAEEGFRYVNLYSDPDFSVATRNPAYFIDSIHLTTAGYTRATQIFVATISSPNS